MKLYLIAPIAEAPFAHDVATQLYLLGHKIVSNWHKTTIRADPTDMVIRRSVLDANIADMAKAETVVALLSRGVGKASYCEIGWWLCSPRGAVVWVQGVGGQGACIFDADDMVTIIREDGKLSAKQLARTVNSVLMTDDPIVEDNAEGPE